MTPDGFSNLQVINCGSIGLFSGNRADHKPDEGFYSQYQMSSWFPDVAVSAVVVNRQSTSDFCLQFLRGVGDEDDGADMQLNIDSGNTPANNAVWVQARSNQNSSHYLQAKIQQPSVSGVGPIIIAATAQGKWPMNSHAGLNFSAPGQMAQLGLPNGDQCLAIIDLQALFPSDLAQMLQQTILASMLSDVDAENIWIAAMRYMGWVPIGRSEV